MPRTPRSQEGHTSYDAAGRQIQSSYLYNYSQYVWGLAYVNDLILRDRNTAEVAHSRDLGITGSGLGEREYAQHDSQFSVISLADSSGTVFQRIAYDPYGKATMLKPDWTADAFGIISNTNDWRVLVQGMTLIEDGPNGGNLEQSLTRLYNVDLGRWLSQDWARYVDGENTHQFVESNPATGEDPSGFFDGPIWYWGADGPPVDPFQKPSQAAAARWQEMLAAWSTQQKAALGKALAAICARCKPTRGQNCTPKDCQTHAQAYADAIVDAIASQFQQHGLPAVSQSFIGAGIISDVVSVFSANELDCGGWQDLTANAAQIVAQKFHGRSAFRVDTVFATSSIVGYHHNWVRISCRSTPPGATPPPGTYVTVDPWPTGGREVVDNSGELSFGPGEKVVRATN